MRIACAKQLSQYSHTGRRSMRSWQAYKYGTVDELQHSSGIVPPAVAKPNDVLVQVHSASVNLIDVKMLDGYGSVALDWMRWADAIASSSSPGAVRQQNIPFPLVLGRDFSGTVRATGKAVNKFKPGDEVWGVVHAHRQGSHSDFTVTTDSCISRKPNNVTHTEAASLPYVALTFWAAASAVGGLTQRNALRKHVFVSAGSGGLGTFGIQLLKAWGAVVTTTVPADATALALQLGADHVIDCKAPDIREQLQKLGGFDVAVDCVNYVQAAECVKPGGIYVTVAHPALANFDRLGIVRGFVSTAASLASQAVKLYGKHGVQYRSAFVVPNAKALEEVCRLVEMEKIRPIVHRTFPFDKLPEAYREVTNGHNRGKTVIEVIAN